MNSEIELSDPVVIRINCTREDNYKGINGKNMYLEIDGKRIPMQRDMRIDAVVDEVATCTVTFVLPEIKYLGE